MTLLHVENLSLSINDTPILNNVNFTINSGEILGLIGESGSGKSMTALSTIGLLPHGSSTSGAIILDGNDLVQLSEKDLCDIRGDDIGMVFQEPMTALNPVQTIGDQVAETLRIHTKTSKRDALKIARDTLNRVGLPADQFPLTRYPHELSGGQRQRVVIAMAIALRPKLLIADEPTTALDVTTQAQILDLLKSLVDEFDMGLMLITHDLGVVAGIADHVAIMRKGEIVEAGPTVQVFQELNHPYTRALFDASSHIPDRKTARADTPVLKLDNVTRDYPTPRRTLFGKPGYFRAVDGVSFTLNRGENLGLVGESGCGKSTLTRAILGLDPITSGTIEVHGQKITSQTTTARHIRRHMQVVFQDPYSSFNPRHKVARLVSEPFHLLDTPPADARKRIDAALTQVGLNASDADKYIHEFSGGQRQRIAIARALIIEPDLIILDEAVSALDVSIRAQILDLLADLSDRLDLSYLFISHDLSVVRAITDRVLIMKAGKIVEQGPTEEIFQNPTQLYTKQLIAAAPNIDLALEKREHAGV